LYFLKWSTSKVISTIKLVHIDDAITFHPGIHGFWQPQTWEQVRVS
jgi:hypothetical protein